MKLDSLQIDEKEIQRKIQETWGVSMGPDALAKMAESNMAMFKAAASAFMPGGKTFGSESAPVPPPAPPASTTPPGSGWGGTCRRCTSP